MEDPRPDLTEDSKDWTRFLNLVKSKNKILANNLHGFRCCGLRLCKEEIGYILKPEIGTLDLVWKTQAEYEEHKKKWLLPYKTELIGLLDEFGNEGG